MCWRRYYFTAALVDNPMVGRLRIQIFGFIGVGTLFMVSAGAYGPLTTPGGIGTFQFLYFFSSFVVSSSLATCTDRMHALRGFFSGGRRLHAHTMTPMSWTVQIASTQGVSQQACGAHAHEPGCSAQHFGGDRPATSGVVQSALSAYECSSACAGPIRTQLHHFPAGWCARTSPLPEASFLCISRFSS